MTSNNPFEPADIDRSGLSELFADIETADDTSSGDTSSGDASLDDLFEDALESDSKEDTEEISIKKTAKPFKVGTAIRAKAIPAGSIESPEDDLQGDASDSEPVTSFEKFKASSEEFTNNKDVDTSTYTPFEKLEEPDVIPVNAGRSFPDLKENVDTTVTTAEWNLTKDTESSLNRRYTEGYRLWPIVDRVMSVAGSDPQVQSMAAGLELINNVSLDNVQKEEIMEILKPKLGLAGIMIPDTNDVAPVLQMAYDELVGISVLGPLWRDSEITEIMVDRWDIVTVERHGRLESTPIKFRDPEHANSVARSLALRVSDRAVSRTINLVTAELPSARVQFAYGPVVKGGLSITIRKFRDLLGLKDLKNFGALDDLMEEFLEDAVNARAGILVSGGTGTGKTTIVNLLSNFIPQHERVLTIEDAFEMQLSANHVVSLQTKEASSADDAVNVTLSHLLRASLRMRPDRIIVGEIREGEGASVMLAAANTGHDGTMTTIHANTVDMALNERLVDLVRQQRSSSDEAIRRTIVNAFDLVVQVSRGRKGNRYIAQIAQVDKKFIKDGIIKPVVIFQGEDEGGATSFTVVNKISPATDLGDRLKILGKTKWLS